MQPRVKSRPATPGVHELGQGFSLAIQNWLSAPNDHSYNRALYDKHSGKVIVASILNSLGTLPLARFLVVLMCLSSGCQDASDSAVGAGGDIGPTTVQQQIKLLEKWTGRWCADSAWEQLNQCEGSQALNQLYGAISAAKGGDGHNPMVLDGWTATMACLESQPGVTADLNGLLANGAKVIVWGNQVKQFTTRTIPEAEQKDYHLVFCHYREVILEGPRDLLIGGKTETETGE